MGPDHQPIEVNAAQIVSIRPVRDAEHFGKGVHCLIHTSDGKFVATLETCAEIDKLLAQSEIPP